MSRRIGKRIAAAALLLTAGPAALAGPGFIANSHVSKGTYLAEVSIGFRCDVQYLSHQPAERGDQLRVQLEPTSVCSGASPLVAESREQHRPAQADDAKLVNVEYDGETGGASILRFNFKEDVKFTVQPSSDRSTIVVRVYIDAAQAGDAEVAAKAAASRSRMVARPAAVTPKFVINLASSRRPPGVADLPATDPGKGRRFFVSEVDLEGETWYRLRLGYFDTADAAARELSALRKDYPTAWIDRDDKDMRAAQGAAMPPAARVSDITTNTSPAVPEAVIPASAPGEISDEKLASLMSDARRAMTAGEISRAVQIYTKVLQSPPNQYQQQAQEYLALARERNGQIAHARAEYQRYLALYPDSEGAERVSQRLSALLSQSAAGSTAVAGNDSSRAAKKNSAWNLRTFFSQYYRRDVNQLNDNDEIVSQSSMYSDLNIDARRRGERFDFSSRVTAGYRTDFLDEQTGSGNDLRVSYAYADLADNRSGLRARAGRQSRNTGGILGRFDGFNLGYQATERLRFEAVTGIPVYSTASAVDDSRRFYGVSTTFGPIKDDIEIGAFYLQQDINGMTDRQVVGGELRYFAKNRSLWGRIDYDTAFREIGSAFLQGSWRLPALFTVTGHVDRRRSPFLSTGSALRGQASTTFEELAASMTEEELRQLALDRAAATNTFTLGLSRPITPKLQINLNASETLVEATPESGGVAATPQSTYSYFSTDLVASSLLKQGDVSILGIRYADSDSTEVWSLNLDTRFPIGRSLRINPRLRVDHREIKSDMSGEWIYTPGIRMQYRVGRKLRLEFEAGRRFANRTLAESDLNRDSYFVNFGYQFFY